MRPSRTRPAKLATAPILSFFEIARTSAPRSKSSRCTATFIRRLSSTGDRWKERHFIARVDARFGLHHVLIDRRTHRPVRREHPSPFAATLAQMVAQRRHRGDARRQLELLRRAAELLAQRGEEKQFHL